VAGLAEQAQVCSPYPHNPTDSPFYYPVVVDTSKIGCSKAEFAQAVLKEGIDLNPHYCYVVDEWPWVRPYLADGFRTENARSIRDRSFNLYLNENYGEREAEETVNAILKVERHFQK
jgi:perosamine synthetase